MPRLDRFFSSYFGELHAFEFFAAPDRPNNEAVAVNILNLYLVMGSLKRLRFLLSGARKSEGEHFVLLRRSVLIAYLGVSGAFNQNEYQRLWVDCI